MFVYISVSQEVVCVGVDHSVLWVIQTITNIVPAQGDIGGGNTVRQLSATYNTVMLLLVYYSGTSE